LQRSLVDRAQLGDSDAFDALAHTVGERCMAIACRILRDNDLAEDALQAALVQAWLQLRTLRDPDRFEPWLHRILANACFAEARNRRRRLAFVGTLPTEHALESGILTVDDRDQLERAMRRLTLEQRAVLVFHHYVGLPLPEVADRLGVPLGTVKSRLHYGMTALRASLEADTRMPVAQEKLA
jgi:RNA polymerase sigma-70 factor, ECF subfamily